MLIPMVSSILTIIISYSIILYYSLHSQKTALLKLYILLSCLYLVWSLGDLSNQLNYLIWPNEYNLFVEVVGKYRYIPSYFFSLVWLVMCLSYSKIINKYRLDKKIVYSIIAFPPMVNLLIYLTNSFHGLVGYWSFEEQRYLMGSAYLVHIVLSAVYYLFGIFLLAYEIKKKSKNSNLFVLIFFISLPTVISYFYYLKGYFDQNIFVSIIPTIQLVSIILLNIAVFRYKFFNIIPVAINDVFSNMAESIIVVNDENKIISFNNAYKSTFSSLPLILLNSDIHQFTELLKKNLPHSPESNKVISIIENGLDEVFNDEIYLVNEKKFISINVKPVMANNNILGRIITFRDITEYRKINRELSVKNQKLEIANAQLKKYASTVKELAVSKERNRFARDLHDSVGHTMSLLISIVSSSIVSFEDKKGNIKVSLEQILAIAQEGLSELRRSVYGLNSENLSTFDLINKLKEQIKKYEQSGIKVNLAIEGDADNSSKFNEEIYYICKECLSNALKHGQPNQVEIIIGFFESIIRVFIIDDGVGCKKVKKGMGLTGIERRVASLNGYLSYGSDGEKGFSVHIEIPLTGGRL